MVIVPIRVERDNSILPTSRDSIRLAGDRSFRDRHGNSQNLQTPRVPFARITLPAEYEIVVTPNPFTVAGGEINGLLERYGMESFDRLAIVVRPFGDRGGERLEGRVTVFDAVGNRVISQEMEYREEQGALVFSSEGKNSAGRNLGSGIYHGMIEIRSFSGDSEQVNVVPVKIGIKAKVGE